MCNKSVIIQPINESNGEVHYGSGLVLRREAWWVATLKLIALTMINR